MATLSGTRGKKKKPSKRVSLQDLGDLYDEQGEDLPEDLAPAKKEPARPVRKQPSGRSQWKEGSVVVFKDTRKDGRNEMREGTVVQIFGSIVFVLDVSGYIHQLQSYEVSAVERIVA